MEIEFRKLLIPIGSEQRYELFKRNVSISAHKPLPFMRLGANMICLRWASFH